jgi:hypothetical protein
MTKARFNRQTLHTHLILTSGEFEGIIRLFIVQSTTDRMQG